MKSITEEQRQALIADCNEQIEILKNLIFNGSYAEGNSNLEGQLLIQEIALASLTAEPVGNVVSMTCINGGVTEARVSMCNPGIPTTLHDVYTAPPVPVIKLPEYQKLLDHPAVMSRWNQCIDEVKRLNGIDG